MFITSPPARPPVNHCATWLAHALLGRLGRFLVVGVLNTSLDFVLFAVFGSWLAWPTVLANPLAYSAGVLNGFFFSRGWVFRDTPRQPLGKQLPQFVVVSVSALLLNTAFVLLVTPLLSGVLTPTIAIWFAKLGATGLGLLWNFGLNQAWTFRAQAPTTESGVKAAAPNG